MRVPIDPAAWSSLACAWALSACSFTTDLDGLQAGQGGAGSSSSASSTSTGDAGGSSSGGGGAGGDGSGGAQGCPEDMVEARNDQLGVAFCVDRTEVTQAAYLAFLIDVGDAAGVEQPAECAFNTTLVDPASPCPDFTTASDLPVFCVDWCDARAYCDWAGKRLCGGLDGASHAPLTASVAQEEWHFACTGGLQTDYPYGDDPIVGACHIPEENTPADDGDDNDKAPVASYPECEGGFPGLFDMQGNVAEWVDWCDPALDGAGNESCHARGGFTYGTALYWDCANQDTIRQRNDTELEIGVRCCMDLP